jgi:cytochrome o ubiquinol oxidase subunit 2
MSRKKSYLVPLFLLLFLGVVGAATLFLINSDIALLEPTGTVAEQQRNLLVIGSLLSLIIVVPVFGLTFFIAWKYREGNKKAKYQPEWDRSKLVESIWWGVPLALILVLSIIAWKSSHDLDPFKELESDKKPLTVQVVALQWKWLFIYPEQGIASVNFVQFPEDRPVTFKITSDAPMNSFWIPKLGGQIYAMAGMETKLHLMASQTGSYEGSSANISGEGFAGMKFTAKASSEADFKAWADSVKQTAGHTLDQEEYAQLAEPSKNNPVAYYSSVEQGLFDTVIMKYMTPGLNTHDTSRQHHPETIEPSVGP